MKGFNSVTGRRRRCTGRGPGKARGSRALLAPHPGTGVSLATSLRVLGTRPLATCAESSPGPSLLPRVGGWGRRPSGPLGPLAEHTGCPAALWGSPRPPHKHGLGRGGAELLRSSGGGCSPFCRLSGAVSGTTETKRQARVLPPHEAAQGLGLRARGRGGRAECALM